MKNDKLDINIVKCFLDEATELNDRFEQILLDFENAESKQESIDKLFRIMHNLKGSSKSSGLINIHRIAHSTENVLQPIRSKTIQPSKFIVNKLLKVADYFKAYILGLKLDLTFYLDCTLLENDLAEVLTHPLESQEAASQESASQESVPISEKNLFEKETNNVELSQPTLNDIKSTNSVEIKNEISDQDLLENFLKKDIRPGPTNSPETILTSPFAGQTSDHPSNQNHVTAPETISNNDSSGPTIPDLKKSEIASSLESMLGQQKNSAKQEEQIRVALWRLDNLINFIGELIIYQSMIKERCMQLTLEDPTLTDAISYMGKVVREVQDISLSLRMIPLKNIFTKIKRAARSTTEMLNKKVNFIMEGEDVELDKIVVDMIGDPLIHLVRNALDHGIESPEDRINKGKEETGTLILRADQKEGNVHITIKDDGAGINRDKVVQYAIERKVISPPSPSQKNIEKNNEEILAILTHPGFSTKEEINEISGRGVGLDVVQTAIEDLKGSLRLESKLEEGTTFYITIPLTLSIIEGMVIYLDEIKYVVPMGQLLETINNSKFVTVTSTGRGKMINLRGEVIPILDLSRMVHGHSSRNSENTINRDFSGLVINYGGRKVSLEVSSIITQQQVVIKNLGKELRDIPGIVGGFILGDGEPGIILNLPEIVKYNVHLFEKGFEKFTA